MGFYTYLKGLISSKIKANGKGAISGDILQEELLRVIDSLTCFKLVGLANTQTNPSPGDEPLMYLADGKGTFTNFSNLEVTEDVCFLCWTSQAWVKVGISVPGGLLEVSEDNLCSVTISIDSLDYTDENVYFFWSSPTEDYVMYMDNGQEPPVISGRTTMGLKSIDTSVFTLNLNVFGFTLTNKQTGSCKTAFSIETFASVISSINNVKDYVTIKPIDRNKLLKEDILNLQEDLNNKANILETGQEYRQYIIDTYNAQWKDGYLLIEDETIISTNVKFSRCTCALQNDIINPILIDIEVNFLSYRPGDTPGIIRPIWIRDNLGIINPSNKASRYIISFIFEYISAATYPTPVRDTLYQESEVNVILSDHNNAHANAYMKPTFNQYYQEFGGSIIDTYNNPFVGNKTLSNTDNNIKVDAFVKYNNANLIMQATKRYNEEPSIDIVPQNTLWVMCHGGNLGLDGLTINTLRKDNGFTNSNQFYTNTILVGAMPKDGDILHPVATYGYGMEFYEYTHREETTDWIANPLTLVYDHTVYPDRRVLYQSQSMANAMVAAKLKRIKDNTKSTWNEVRLAARATASLHDNWDMYHGFGIINVEAAIEYIEANYTTASVEIGNRYSEDKGYSDKLDYKHIHDNTPVPKGLMEKYIQDNSFITTYTNSTPVQQPIGDIKVGDTFSEVPIPVMLDKIIYPYQSPAFSTFSLSNGITVLECGVNWSGTTNATFTFTNSSNIKANTLSIYQDITSILSNQSVVSPKSITLITITKTVDGQTITMKIEAENTNDILFNRSFNVTWYMPYYFGVGTVGLDVTAIQLLTKSITSKANITKTYSTSSQVPYLAYPTSRGLLTSILDKSGYETISDFTRTERTFVINGISAQYYVYEFNNPSTANNLQITYKY